jgi:predicted nuclease of restriction endonuclease-like (RecB) superfamily
VIVALLALKVTDDSLPFGSVRVLSVDSSEARIYYECEALRGGWTVRMLDRQIATNAFERLKWKSSNAQGLIPNEHPDEYIRDPHPSFKTSSA